MRQIIKKRRTMSPAEAALSGGPESVQPEVDHGEHASILRPPGARLVHVDGKVQAIEVTCRCGEVSVLEIEYEQ